jgi:hypothetical protein
MPQRSRKSPQRLSVWSKRHFGQLDQRTAEAIEERRIVRELTEHVGRPTAPQRILIRRAARALVIVTLLERRTIENPNDFGDLALRQLCALTNSARLALQALGFARPEQQAPALVDYIGKRKSAA